MCGIYGSTILYNQDQVRSKLERTQFRGPDQHGFQYYEDRLVLGHNRLSIIDLDERSNQPFSYEHVHIVFNGEIYNFKSIKAELIKKGYTFRTTGDTEVICASYLEYGKKCLDHLNGMFAMVIYDERNKTLFGARDRMGQKPFYYYHRGTDFEFSSQISSIQLHHNDLTISRRSIGYYLGWNNIPDPYSIFNEVSKLKAGHCFEFDMNTGSLTIDQYWDIDYLRPSPFKGTYDDAVDHLNSLLYDATEIRLFADVPVGVFLSGGIDSSLIASMAAKSVNHIKSFTVKFNEQGFDESGYARQVADHLGTDHHEIPCHVNEGLDLIDNFTYYYDEPYADSSAIPTMLLSKYTRKQVTVAVSGDSGDENFLGYHRYTDSIYQRIFNYPYAIRKPIGHLLKHASKYRTRVISKGLRIKSFEDYYMNTFIGIDHDWLKTDFDLLDLDERKYLFHKEKDRFERMADFDLKTYLNWIINTKVDRASMAFSLEARSPIMDHRVVEFANSLPREFKMQGVNQKRILKDVLYKYCPKEIFDRPKAGFTMPFSEWFRNELKPLVMDELSMDQLKQFPMIDPKATTFRIEQHMNGSWNRYPLIWKLLILKQWLNRNSNSHSIV